MEISANDLRQRYESMDTGQLLELRHRGTLTEVASKALEEVLAGRDVSAQQDQQAAVELHKNTTETRLLAHFGARFLGRLIDQLIFLLVIFIVGGTTVAMSIAAKSELFQTLATVFTCALAFGYWLFCDAMPNGQSVGKGIVGTAAVDAVSLKPCTFGQSFLRHVFILVLGPFDLITMGNSKRQRVGDLVARTMVVNLSALQARQQPSASVTPS